jgi:prevent-host-death family protein
MMTTMTRMTNTHNQGRARATWAIAEAKARFSEMIDCALTDGPQTITRKGQKAVVVVSNEEWQRKTKRRGNLAEFFAASPFRSSDLKIKRSKDQPRAVDL